MSDEMEREKRWQVADWQENGKCLVWFGRTYTCPNHTTSNNTQESHLLIRHGLANNAAVCLDY